MLAVLEDFRKVFKGFDALSVNILRLPWLANPSNRDAQSCTLWDECKRSRLLY